MAGHMEVVEEMRNSCEILISELQRKWPRRTYMCRRGDNIKMGFSEMWGGIWTRYSWFV